MLVAKRMLDLGSRTVSAGDPVPEAAAWPNLQFYKNLGWIDEVPAADEPEEGSDATDAAPSTPAPNADVPTRSRTGGRSDRKAAGRLDRKARQAEVRPV